MEAKKVWVLVCMWEGLVKDVEVYSSETAALEGLEKWVGLDLDTEDPEYDWRPKTAREWLDGAYYWDPVPSDVIDDDYDPDHPDWWHSEDEDALGTQVYDALVRG